MAKKKAIINTEDDENEEDSIDVEEHSRKIYAELIGEDEDEELDEDEDEDDVEL
jgi:hypothetical protein